MHSHSHVFHMFLPASGYYRRVGCVASRMGPFVTLNSQTYFKRKAQILHAKF